MLVRDQDQEDKELEHMCKEQKKEQANRKGHTGKMLKSIEKLRTQVEAELRKIDKEVEKLEEESEKGGEYKSSMTVSQCIQEREEEKSRQKEASQRIAELESKKASLIKDYESKVIAIIREGSEGCVVALDAMYHMMEVACLIRGEETFTFHPTHRGSRKLQLRAGRAKLLLSFHSFNMKGNTYVRLEYSLKEKVCRALQIQVECFRRW